MAINDRIARLDGFVNVARFFEETDLKALTEAQLRKLLVKLATLDGQAHLSSFVMVVSSELESRDHSGKFKVTTAIAVIALIISIVSIVLQGNAS